MNIRGVFAVGFLYLFALTACGTGLLGDDGSEVVESFFAATRDNDLEAAHELLSSPLKDHLSVEKMERVLTALSLNEGVETNWDERAQEGPFNALYGSVTDSNGESTAMIVRLVSEDTGWKINEIMYGEASGQIVISADAIRQSIENRARQQVVVHTSRLIRGSMDFGGRSPKIQRRRGDPFDESWVEGARENGLTGKPGLSTLSTSDLISLIAASANVESVEEDDEGNMLVEATLVSEAGSLQLRYTFQRSQLGDQDADWKVLKLDYSYIPASDAIGI